ncbi:hypothetical protein ES703_119872 [subsurface metagenome]
MFFPFLIKPIPSIFFRSSVMSCSSSPTNSNIVYSASPLTTKSMFGCERQSTGLAEGCSPSKTVMMSLSTLFTTDATSNAALDQPENGMLIPTMSGDHRFILLVISLFVNPTR